MYTARQLARAEPTLSNASIQYLGHELCVSAFGQPRLGQDRLDVEDLLFVAFDLAF